jgi:hypothetical protein
MNKIKKENMIIVKPMILSIVIKIKKRIQMKKINFYLLNVKIHIAVNKLFFFFIYKI